MNDSSIYVYNLTRNVSINHLKEIFMNFGTLKDLHYVTYGEESISDDKKGGDNYDEKEDSYDEKEDSYDKKEDNCDKKEDNYDKKEDNCDEDNYICVHIKYENSKEAQSAKEFMDGGQIDGKIISVKYKINHKYIKTYKKKKEKKKKKIV
ncbi:RNA-binding protein s1, putative [Plasmodium sp. DRC-Itaito]|nr:RNA-binding protein s1, putative [Plasmodium sp. DRC-Itaito]